MEAAGTLKISPKFSSLYIMLGGGNIYEGTGHGSVCTLGTYLTYGEGMSCVLLVNIRPQGHYAKGLLFENEK